MDNYKNLPKSREYRTRLRKNLTPAEAYLWKILKNSQLDGRKFRRQYGIGKYILDFYCPSERLCIELDGESHFHTSTLFYENERRRFIEHFGVRILRFENKMVFTHPDLVVERIRSNFGWWKSE